MLAAKNELPIGESGRPGILDIGAWRVTAFWNREFEPPKVETKLWVEPGTNPECRHGTSYDHKMAVRLFDTQQLYAEFVQGLRDGKSPKPLGQEYNIYGIQLREGGTTEWNKMEMADRVMKETGLPVPLNDEHLTNPWDEL